MLIEIYLAPSAMRVLAALVIFCVGAGCILYIYFAAREVRWSRSRRRFATRSAQPEIFWVKFVFCLVATVLTIGLGVLLLLPTPKMDSPWDIQLPTLDSGHRR